MTPVYLNHLHSVWLYRAKSHLPGEDHNPRVGGSSPSSGIEKSPANTTFWEHSSRWRHLNYFPSDFPGGPRWGRGGVRWVLSEPITAPSGVGTSQDGSVGLPGLRWLQTGVVVKTRGWVDAFGVEDDSEVAAFRDRSIRSVPPKRLVYADAFIASLAVKAGSTHAREGRSPALGRPRLFLRGLGRPTTQGV